MRYGSHHKTTLHTLHVRIELLHTLQELEEALATKALHTLHALQELEEALAAKAREAEKTKSELGRVLLMYSEAERVWRKEKERLTASLAAANKDHAAAVKVGAAQKRTAPLDMHARTRQAMILLAMFTRQDVILLAMYPTVPLSCDRWSRGSEKPRRCGSGRRRRPTRQKWTCCSAS
jgi:hypothetical protein